MAGAFFTSTTRARSSSLGSGLGRASSARATDSDCGDFSHMSFSGFGFVFLAGADSSPERSTTSADARFSAPDASVAAAARAGVAAGASRAVGGGAPGPSGRSCAPARQAGMETNRPHSSPASPSCPRTPAHWWWKRPPHAMHSCKPTFPLLHAHTQASGNMAGKMLMLHAECCHPGSLGKCCSNASTLHQPLAVVIRWL